MKKIIISILCFGMAFLAYAQAAPSAEPGTNTGNGVLSVDSKHINKFAFSYTPGKLSYKDSESSSSVQFGYQSAGMTYTHSIAVARFPLYVEFGGGLQYTFNPNVEFKAVSVYVPVNLFYRFSFLEGKMHISPFTGFYCRYNAWAKEGDAFLLGKDNPDMYAMKRAQFGWQVGASLDIKDFYVHLAYNTDMSSVLQHVKGFFRGINIGLGVIF